MNPFELESDGAELRLRLSGEVTIEHARELHTALQAALAPDSRLRVDAAEVTRIDAAVLQVLIAAARAGASTEIAAGSSGWALALARFGFNDTLFAPSRLS